MMGPVRDVERDVVPLGQATRAWFRISLQTFGGPAGQIAVMQREPGRRAPVDRRAAVPARAELLHAAARAEAQQLAIYTGWLLNGWLGGLIAGVLFVIPGFVAILGLSWLYVAHGDTAVVTGLFLGLAPAVVAIVVQAVVRIAGRALHHRALVWLAVAAFLMLAVLGLPFPLVVLGAGAVGWALGRWRPEVMARPAIADGDDDEPPLVPDDALHRARPSARRNLAILAGGPGPVGGAGRGGVGAGLGLEDRLHRPGPVLRRDGAGDVRRRLRGARLRRAGGRGDVRLALGRRDGARARAGRDHPGPLIMVVQFVAFLGAYRNPGDLDPWLAAVLGSMLTVWVTFVPCFLFIFLGAPYVERLRDSHTLSAALTGVTAAVVGVIANLAVYFAVHTLFARTSTVSAGPIHLDVPVWSSYVPESFLITAVAMVLVFGLKWSVLRTLGACALLGLVVSYLF